MNLNSDYDKTFFRSKLHRGRHIESIHTNCFLRGIQTEIPHNARVLEIGCATGHALFPMALEYPQATFVGVDPSDLQIKEAKLICDKLKLSNIDFRCGTAQQVLSDGEKFDYILCHGVVSWIPSSEVDSILTAIKKCLSSKGVALVSYNVSPGSQIRQSFWSHIKQIVSSAGSVEKIRSLLSDLRSIIEFDYERPYQVLLYQELTRILSESDSYLVHEVLAEHNNAFSYQDFEQKISQFGLTQLLDVKPHRNGMNRLNSSFVPDEAYQAFSRLQNNLLSSDILLDGTTGLPFRESIITTIEVSNSSDYKNDQINFEKLYTLSYALASCQILEEQDQEGSLAIQASSGRIEKIKHPLLKDIFSLLSSVSPNFVPFSLIQSKFPNEDPLLIARALSECINREIILVSSYPPSMATSVYAHPNTTEYLRFQSGKEEAVTFTSLRYETVEVDPLAAKFVQHLDGQTDKDSLLNLVRVWLTSGQGKIRADGIVVEDLSEIEQNLPTLVESTLQTLRKGGILLP
jgi:SAM-dependent methyltransferase